MDRATRRRGYEAYGKGVPLTDNPELDHPNPETIRKKLNSL